MKKAWLQRRQRSLDETNSNNSRVANLARSFRRRRLKALDTSSVASTQPSESDYLETPNSLMGDDDDVLSLWIESMDSLLSSPQLHLVVDRSRDLVGSAALTVWHTATWPVVAPTNLAWTVVTTTVDLVWTPPETSNPVQQLVGGLWNVPGNVVGLAGSVVGAVAGVVLSAVLPPASSHQQQRQLEYEPCSSTAADKQQYQVDGQVISSFLLRVEDLGCANASYIDLKTVDPTQLQQVLRQFSMHGLSLIAQHATVRTHQPVAATLDIPWKMEGNTPQILKKLAQKTTVERLQVLQRDVLVWSGSHAAAPLFLARGIIQKSPLQLLQLLWTDRRTVEYNQYCLGRTTVLDLQVLNEEGRGTKVVQSETRVPLTGMSVQAHCLMHVEPLQAPDVGYVIVSRTLCKGTVDNVTSPASQILWGVNILRHVPHCPDLVDLTSVSQVASNLVPPFLSTKIAKMGVAEFFERVRGHREG